jgi:hypothetical protein
MTMTDEELRDALAPLRADEPTEAEVAAVLAAATSASARPRRRRASWRPVAAVALAAAVAGLVLAGLPGSSSQRAVPQPLTALGLLRTTAAVAADQPEPPPWAGYRYVKSRNLWTYSNFVLREGDKFPRPTGSRYTIEQTEEVWVDRTWHGRRLAAAGKLVSGHPSQGGDFLLKPHDMLAPGDMPNLYGDGALANVPLSELPADPTQLYDLLVAANQDLRWSTGHAHWAQGRPTTAQARYDVLRAVLLLLTEANTTPSQRAALIGVLGEYDGVEPLASVRDHAGREGRGVEIPVARDDGLPQAPVRVIFAPHTSELLEWSEGGDDPGEVHTYLAWGHVAAIGDRP